MRPQTILLPKEAAERRQVRAQRVATFLGALDPKRPWEIIVRPFKRTRTNQQNRYLRHCAAVISDAIGYEPEEVYEYLLGTRFGWRSVACPKTPNNPRGIRDVPARTTTKNEDGDRDVLNKQDFWELVEWVQRFAAKRGIVIPDPDPLWWEKEQKTERAA